MPPHAPNLLSTCAHVLCVALSHLFRHAALEYSLIAGGKRRERFHCRGVLEAETMRLDSSFQEELIIVAPPLYNFSTAEAVKKCQQECSFCTANPGIPGINFMSTWNQFHVKINIRLFTLPEASGRKVLSDPGITGPPGVPGDKASTRSRGPATRVTCHGNQDSPLT